MFTKSVMLSVSVTNVLFFTKHEAKVIGQYFWDISLSQQMLDAIKLIVDNNFVLQQDSAPVHLAFNTVQLLQCETLNFLALELLTHNSPELNSTDYEIRESYSGIRMSCE